MASLIFAPGATGTGSVTLRLPGTNSNRIIDIPDGSGTFLFMDASGVIAATQFNGSGAGLTALPAAQLTGTIPSAVLGASSLYIGTTAVALNRASAALSLDGLTLNTPSINGKMTANGGTSNSWAAASGDGIAFVGTSSENGISSITTYLDTSSLRIGAGTTQKTGILINGQTSANGSSIYFSTGGATRAYFDTGGMSITGTLSVSGAITGSLTGNVTGNVTGTSASAPLLSPSAAYSFTASTNGRAFTPGIKLSFNSATEGYPSYGSVVRINTYANDGGSAELYFPYSAAYGGSSMRYRLGLYDNAGWTGWKTVIDSDNIGSQSVANATTVAGLAVHTARNNVANQIVRTDSSGYLQVGYINSSNGDEGNASSPVRVWGTNGSDSYLRTYLTSSLAAGSLQKGSGYLMLNNATYGAVYQPSANGSAAIHVWKTAAGGDLGYYDTSGNLVLGGNLTVGNGQVNSTITMGDADEGNRLIHCNSNRIGFLTQAGGWGAWCDDAGNFFTDYSLIGSTAVQTNGYFQAGSIGRGLLGIYQYNLYQGVFAMGSAYVLPADGSTTGNLYGLAWSYPGGQGGPSANLDSHGLLVLINGAFASCMSYSIKASGNVTAYSDERLKTNWRYFPSNFVEQLALVKSGTYDRIDGLKMTQVGVSAQSLRLVMPYAVVENTDEDKTLAVSYGNAAMAASVEIAKRVVTLTNDVETLKQLVQELMKGRNA